MFFCAVTTLPFSIRANEKMEMVGAANGYVAYSFESQQEKKKVNPRKIERNMSEIKSQNMNKRRHTAQADSSLWTVIRKWIMKY